MGAAFIREQGLVTLTVAMTPVPAPYIRCCWNMHFLSNLRDPGFFLSGREDGRAGGTHRKKKRECSLCRGASGQGGEGLWPQLSLSEGWRWKMALD